MFQTKTPLFTILATALLLSVGCDDKNPVANDHDDAFEISYTYSPSPATVGTEISFTFEVESEGEHVEGLAGTACEFEMAGMSPVEIDLVEAEHGHYTGTSTFSMAGEYEIHFHYMHDGEENHMEMTSSITVVE